jgi:3-hydroxyacyl-CoA dehydrogenase
MTFDIRNIAVLGAGAMGNGIAQVSAQAGYQVIMQDITEEALEKGMDTIKKSLSKLVRVKSPLMKWTRLLAG